MKNIVEYFSRFSVKFIRCIDFGSSSFVIYLNLSQQLACSNPENKDNLLNSQLCNHLFDQLQSL